MVRIMTPELRKAIETAKNFPRSKTEADCANCGVRAWKTMMRKIDGVYICKGCWEKLAEEVINREIRKELVRQGRFNPSER